MSDTPVEEPQDRPRIYIAAPYSSGDVAVNVRTAMNKWQKLWEKGYSPICPHLSHFLHMNHPMAYENWLEYDREWLVECDALLRLPGASSGADKEVALARQHGIPVFNSEAAMDRYFRGLGKIAPERQEQALSA